MTTNLERSPQGYTWCDVGGNRYAAAANANSRGFSVFHLENRGGAAPVVEFTRISQIFDTEEQAIADLVDFVTHLDQRAKLARRSMPGQVQTPWGRSDSMTVYGEGIVSFGTPGHGGFKLDRARNAKVNLHYRVAGGWYEEDAEWAKVAATFPEYFTDRERRLADRSLRNWVPDEYEAVNGVVLQPGQSNAKDERTFMAVNRDNWVVISASMDESDAERCICWATKGGERTRYEGGREIKVEDKVFVVPTREYQQRPRFGFVIDEARHPIYEPPAPALGAA